MLIEEISMNEGKADSKYFFPVDPNFFLGKI